MIRKIRYRLAFNRSGKLNVNGTGLVEIEARLNGKTRYFSAHLHVRPNQFEHGLIVNHPQCNDLNTMLYEEILRIQEIEIDFWRRGITPSLTTLAGAVRSNYVPNCTFTEFARNLVMADTRRRTGTKVSLESTIKVIQLFRQRVCFEDLNHQFLIDFEKWLKEDYKAANNTVIKHLRHLRTLVNEAIKQKYMKPEDYPFKDFKLKPMARKEVFLTPSELHKVEQYQGEKGNVVDVFLFACYTGLRFSDIQTLTDKHIIKERGKVWLIKETVKSNETVRLPLYLLFEGKAVGLLQKYGNAEEIAGLARKNINMQLKKVITGLGIEKKVTMHTARHTFATLLLHQGVPITTVQRLCGHREIATTMVYADVMADTVIRDLKSASKKS